MFFLFSLMEILPFCCFLYHLLNYISTPFRVQILTFKILDFGLLHLQIVWQYETQLGLSGNKVWYQIHSSYWRETMLQITVKRKSMFKYPWNGSKLCHSAFYIESIKLLVSLFVHYMLTCSLQSLNVSERNCKRVSKS